MRFFQGITRSVVVLGLVSFFTDLASEMLYPIIPLFLRGTLGVSVELLGLIEGIAEGISTGLRWIGGVLSDLSGKRKPFVFFGYTLSALSKPIMGLAAKVTFLGTLGGGWGVFLAGRSADRLGKSIRTAARDALIADATAPEFRGVAFGLHRAMDTCGAIAGPLVALLILWHFPSIPLAWLFFIALFPGLVSSLLVLLFIKDKPHSPEMDEARKKARFWQSYPAAFWKLLAAAAVFSLGNSSDSFLILRAAEAKFGSADGSATILTEQAIYATGLYITFNAVYAAIAIPAGKLSDRLSRKSVIGLGWLVYAAVYAGFAFLTSSWMGWALFALYGIYQALTEGITKAYVTDLVPQHQRAGAIGLYYTVAGLVQLLASLGTGVLWKHLGPAWAFGACAACALAALPVLLWVPERKGSS